MHAALRNRTTHAHFDIRSIDLRFLPASSVALCKMQASERASKRTLRSGEETSFIMYSEREKEGEGMSGAESVGPESENG